MTCPRCNYTWTPRKSDPVSCPRCKQRLDWPGRTDAARLTAHNMRRTLEG